MMLSLARLKEAMIRLSKLLSIVLGIVLVFGTSLQFGAPLSGQASLPEAVTQLRTSVPAVASIVSDRRVRGANATHPLTAAWALPLVGYAASPTIQWLILQQRLANAGSVPVTSRSTRSPPAGSTQS
jgi:hypothetical protein